MGDETLSLNTRAHPSLQTLPDLFEAQVSKSPEAIALVFEHQRITYRDLDERANRLAHHLITRGVGPEVVVALALDRSIEMIVALLAVLKAGGAYLPLDSKAPPDRIQFILTDSGGALLLATRSTARGLGLEQLDLVVCLDDPGLAAEIAQFPPRSPTNQDRRAPLGANNLAYLIYTSGSTGRPKGVEITHHNVERLFHSTSHVYDFGPDDRWTLFHSYAFDFSVWEIWGALIHGGRLVVVSDDVRRSPSDFLKLLVREKVTVLNQTPSAFYALMRAEEQAPSADLALRFIIFGGEGLDLGRLRPWYHLHDDRAPILVNMYGITETTVHVTWLRLDADLAASSAESLIGEGIPDWTVHILDQRLNPVAEGEIGEIYVAGPGLARGYHSRPGLTSERFIACPFGLPGARMYRSGDLARRRPGGGLEYLGRADQQVKIRGFRIELGEIDAALEGLSDVGQSATAVKEVAGEERLVGYLVAKAGCGPRSTVDLRAALATRLPDYMVPSTFVYLDALPLTINGKLDRKALPTPEVIAETSYRAPADQTEIILCEHFRQLTGAKQVGVDDSFFDLGGHSLLAVQLMLEIEERFDKKLPLTAVFYAPTVAELAEVVRGGKTSPEWLSLIPIRQGGSAAPVFMVHWLERELASRLDENRPVWGLSLGLAQNFLDIGRTMPASIEETAAHYVDEMRSARPEGPYLLLGHSAGGVVAFEMARQLVADGHSVAFLGLLDAEFPRQLDSIATYPLRRQISNIIQMPYKYKIQYILRTLRQIRPAILGDEDLVQEGSSLSTGYRARFTESIMPKYKPTTCALKIHYFKSTVPIYPIRRSLPPPPEQEWARVALGGVETHAVEGDHMEIVKDPLASSTAIVINKVLSDLP